MVDVVTVVAGLGSLVDRGRGVARVDGPGSPPAPPPAAALVLESAKVVLVLLLVEVGTLVVLAD